MSCNRAAKSGIAFDTQQKILEKWDGERAVTAMNWVSQRIGEDVSVDGSMDAVFERLKDGIVLCKLANWVQPGSIPANKLAKPPTMAFKQMELIGMFLKVMDDGVKLNKSDTFQTIDLFEQVNLVQVILCIEALGRKMLGEGREGFGKAESHGQKKEWTEEQLKAGQNIIGLQMGSNKGASQSGQNFGKGRHIVD